MTRYLLLLIYLLPAYAIAQQAIPEYPLPQAARGLQGAKVTGTGSRNVAQTIYIPSSSSGPIFDSTHYSFVSPTSPAIAEAHMYAITGGAWRLYQKQVYDYAGTPYVASITTMAYDTLTSVYRNTYRTMTTYDAAGFKTEDRFQSWDSTVSGWMNGSRITYARNDSNQVTLSITQNWRSTDNTWVNHSERSYIFNAAYKVEQHTIRFWIPATNAWRNSSRYDYTYDASGSRIITETYYSWDIAKSLWSNTYIATYTHTASGKTQEMQTYLWNTVRGAFDTSDKYIYTYDAADNQTELTRVRWSTAQQRFNNLEQFRQTYNSFNQLLTRHFFTWNGGAWVPASGIYTYYYELYDDSPTAVPVVTGQSAMLSVSPVPAGSMLEMAVSWTQPQAFHAAISDLHGREIRSFSGRAAADYRTRLSTAELPSGQYILTVRGALGDGATRMFSVHH